MLKVVDGDTVDIFDDVRGRLRIRVLGIDTPETKSPATPSAAGVWRQASSRNRACWAQTCAECKLLLQNGYYDDREVWVPVVGFDGYEISDQGRVRDARTHTAVKATPK